VAQQQATTPQDSQTRQQQPSDKTRRLFSMRYFSNPIKKSSVSENNNEIIEKLERLEKELQSTQSAIAEMRRDFPFYLSKALLDYKRGFSC